MKNFKQILKSIEKNDGATFNPFFTEDDGSFVQPTDGYAVGGYADSRIVETNEDIIPLTLVEYVISHSVELSDPNTYVGVWIDGEETTFDVVKVINDPAIAYMTGYRNGEKAIYDVARAKVIYLTNPQKCGTESQKTAYKHQCADRFKASQAKLDLVDYIKSEKL